MREIKEGSFIYEQEAALSPEICAEAIRLFEAHPEEYSQGETARGVNLDLKVSFDLKISRQNAFRDIDREFYLSTSNLLKDIPDQDWMYDRDITDAGYQLQRTDKGGYYKRHYDAQGKGAVAVRQLVIIWYLNDSFEGGHTDFEQHGVSIKPEIGKALLFPPYWTHIHEGCTVHQGSKYIGTTWIS